MASERDIQDVINTLIAEGIGEGPEGMRRIAETILNRAEQRGISPAEVVRQRSQYTGFSNPGPGAVQAMLDPNAITAAQAAWQMAQGPDDPTNGANHYWNPNIVNPSWAGSMQSLGQYGNHAFATDIPNWQRPAPRVAPLPLMQSQDMRLMRNPTMNPLLSQPRTAPTPASVEDRVTSRNLANMATSKRNQVTPASVEERVTARNRVPVSPFGDDPMTPSIGTVVATIPSNGGPATSIRPTIRVQPSAQNNIASAMTEQLVQRPAPTAPKLTPVGVSNIASQRAEQLATRAKPVGVQMPTTQQILNGTGFRGGPISTAPERLTPGLQTNIAPPPYTGTAAQAVRSPIGTGVAMATSPGIALPRPRPTGVLPLAASSANIAPVQIAPMAAPRVSAPPLMAQSQQPLRIVIPQANAIPYPQARPQAIISQQRVNTGRDAVSQSGDTSSGNQREAAERRAMGDAWRASR